MLNGPNRLRNHAIVLALKACGLRVSDLSMLDYGDYVEAETVYNDQGEPHKVFDPKITEKMKIDAYIHMGPEEVFAIDAYLDERQEKGEVLTAESPLFLRANGPSIERVTAPQLTHLIRNFHKTRLEKAHMARTWIHKLQGKAKDVYSQPEEEGDLTEEYVACYDFLRVLDKPVAPVLPHSDMRKDLNDVMDSIIQIRTHLGIPG